MAPRVSRIEYIEEEHQSDEGISLFAGVVFAGLVIFLFLYFALPLLRNTRQNTNVNLQEGIGVQVNRP